MRYIILQSAISVTDGHNEYASPFQSPPPLDERESFAHRYAETMRAHLTRFGIIPFDRIVPLGT
jgi:hypothetical protein